MESAHQFSFRPDCQQYSGRTVFSSAYCSLSNPICFWTMRCRRTMIPRKILTGLAKFQEIVSVNDFWFPRRLQELWQFPLCFLRSFRFARIWLNPLGGKVLHHDCRWSAVIKSLWARLHQHVFCKKPSIFSFQADIAMWVLRKGRVDTTLTLTRVHLCSRLHCNSWEELAVSRSLGAGFHRGSLGLRSSTKFSLKSCCQSGKSSNRSRCTSSDSSFLLLFSVSVDLCSGFPCWTFGVSVDVKYGILWWRWWCRCRRCRGTRDYAWHIF